MDQVPLIALVRSAATLGREVVVLLVGLARDLKKAPDPVEAAQAARRVVAEVTHAQTRRAAAAALHAQKK